MTSGERTRDEKVSSLPGLGEGRGRLDFLVLLTHLTSSLMPTWSAECSLTEWAPYCKALGRSERVPICPHVLSFWLPPCSAESLQRLSSPFLLFSANMLSIRVLDIPPKASHYGIFLSSKNEAVVVSYGAEHHNKQ